MLRHFPIVYTGFLPETIYFLYIGSLSMPSISTLTYISHAKKELSGQARLGFNSLSHHKVAHGACVAYDGNHDFLK